MMSIPHHTLQGVERSTTIDMLTRKTGLNMNTTLQVLDLIKSTHNVTSDYAVSKLLGVTRATISRYRNSGGQFDDKVADRAAKLIKTDSAKLIASLHRERAMKGIDKEIWMDIESKCNFAKDAKKQEVIEALSEAAKEVKSPAHRKILAELTQQCILCKIGNIRRTATFSPIYQNIPKKHLN
jgi:predicted transcriptional regulator